jgi:hypothetical protein
MSNNTPAFESTRAAGTFTAGKAQRTLHDSQDRDAGKSFIEITALRNISMDEAYFRL